MWRKCPYDMVCCTAPIQADKTNATYRLSAFHTTHAGHQLQKSVSCRSHTLLRTDSPLLQITCCFQVQNCPASLQGSTVATQPRFISFHLSCVVLCCFIWRRSVSLGFTKLFLTMSHSCSSRFLTTFTHDLRAPARHSSRPWCTTEHMVHLI